MAKGEVTIDPDRCRGCGYCVKFCSRHCLEIPKDNFTPDGYMLAVFKDPDKCNVCGICGWMCPHFALEVYKYADAEPEAVKR